MKLFYFLIILVIFQGCSLDNKTGIWKNENSVTIEKKDIFNEFKQISTSNESFNKTIYLDKKFKFNLKNSIENNEWKDIFFNQTNNFVNFKYQNKNQLIFKSKKLTKYNVNKYLLVEKNNLITTDLKGNIIIYSINDDKIISRYNFYKKKYKKIKKKINYIVENNILYISDNIGFLYAFDYRKNKILWAKNYKIPFRSNLKIIDNKLVAATQNNNLYFFNKDNGSIIKLIPTEESIVKNKFINNLSSFNETILFLNTYGSLYAVNSKSLKIIWVNNLNQSTNFNPSNIFSSNEIINNGKIISISTNHFTYIIDLITGSILYKKNFSSKVKPIIVKDYLFLISKNNLLISMNINTGKIIYSYDINQKISDYFSSKKRTVNFKSMMFLNNKLFIFLENSFLLKFNINANLEEVIKMPSKINTNPILIGGSILYLDFKNKLSILD